MVEEAEHLPVEVEVRPADVQFADHQVLVLRDSIEAAVQGGRDQHVLAVVVQRQNEIVLSYLERYQPDAIRYTLAAIIWYNGNHYRTTVIVEPVAALANGPTLRPAGVYYADRGAARILRSHLRRIRQVRLLGDR